MKSNLVKSQIPFYFFKNQGKYSLLYLDLVNLAYTKLKTAQLLYDVNEDLFMTLMKDFVVGSLDIRKAPLKTIEGYNDLGTKRKLYDDANEYVLARTKMREGVFEESFLMSYFGREFSANPNNLVKTNSTVFNENSTETFDVSKKIGYIKELPENERFLKQLYLIDEIYDSFERKDYKIKIACEFNDNFKRELQKRYDALSAELSRLELIYSGFAINPSRQNIINFFSSNGISLNPDLSFNEIESQEAFRSSIFKIIENRIHDILETLNKDKGQNLTTLRNVIKNLYVNTVSTDSYRNVVDYCSRILKQFSEKYDLQSNPGASSKQTVDSTRRVEFIVNKLVKYQRKRNGAFRFFDLKGDSPIVNRNYLIQRGYDEFSKFFDVTPASSDILSITSDLTEDQAQKFVDFETSRYLYFSPIEFVKNDEKVDFSSGNLSMFKEEAHQGITDLKFEDNVGKPPPKKKIKNRGRLRGKPKFKKKKRTKGRKKFKARTRGFLSTLVARRPFKQNKAIDTDQTREDVKEYLGSSSLILSQTESARQKEETQPDAVVTIKNYFADDVILDSFKFLSLTNDESIILRNKNQIDFSLFPLQIKALILSNYELSRFAFNFEETDLLNVKRFAVIMNNIFSKIKVASYIDGFEINELGLRNLSEPIYMPVSNDAVNSTKTLAVFLEDYKNNFVQIVENDNIVSTDTFILVEGEGPSEQAATMRQELSDTIPDRFVKRYSSNNQIRQSSKSQQLMKLKVTPAIGNQAQQQANRPTQTQNQPNRTPTRRLRPSGGGY